MIELSQAQLNTLESIALEDYFTSIYKGWLSHCERHGLPYARLLTYEQHRYYAHEIVKSCEARGVTERLPTTILIYRLWQASALGFPDAFLADAIFFVLDECSASEYGFSWLAYCMDAAQARAMSAGNEQAGR